MAQGDQEKVSEIPTPPGFFEPLLRLLASAPAGTMRRRDLLEATADALALSTEQRAELLPRAPTPRYIHRAGWGLNMLKSAGYATRGSTKGDWTISASGRALLTANPGTFPTTVVKSIVRAANSDRESPGADDASDVPVLDGTSPEERIESAVEQIRREVGKDLLARIGAASPTFFEELVLELLNALGYGDDASATRHVGRTGDGGIDGIIALDRLGFDKIYVQAKRWQGSVGRPDVQGFVGALQGRHAKKGLMVTTSTFTKEARDFATNVSDSLVLVDGERLVALMIDHQVGVTHHKIVTIPAVDGDRFAEE